MIITSTPHLPAATSPEPTPDVTTRSGSTTSERVGSSTVRKAGTPSSSFPGTPAQDGRSAAGPEVQSRRSVSRGTPRRRPSSSTAATAHSYEAMPKEASRKGTSFSSSCHGAWSVPTAWWWVMDAPRAVIASPAARLATAHRSPVAAGSVPPAATTVR